MAIGPGLITTKEIADVMRVALQYHARRGFKVADADVERIQRDLVARFDGSERDEANLRGAVDYLSKEIKALLDAADEVRLGGVPIIFDKIEPIEDEL